MNVELLAKYGVTLENITSPDSLVTLNKVYNDLNTSLTDEKEKAKGESETGNPAKDAFVESVMSNEELAFVAKETESAIRNLVADVLTQNGNMALHLHKVLEQISKDMTGEKNYQIAVALKGVDSPATEIDLPEDWSERREEASQVAEMIRNLFTTFQAVYMADEKFKKNFPLKDKVEKGKTVGKIPNLPKLVRKVDEDEETAPVGKAAANSRVRFNWNGEDLPENIMLNEVLHDYVSDFKSGYIVTWTQFKEAIEEKAKTKSYAQAAIAGTSIEFATGTLTLSVTK